MGSERLEAASWARTRGGERWTLPLCGWAAVLKWRLCGESSAPHAAASTAPRNKLPEGVAYLRRGVERRQPCGSRREGPSMRTVWH